MKYINASGILPGGLLKAVQTYYQGGYLYIPKKNPVEIKRRTDYSIELEKRNQQIFLKHLEGRTSGQLETIYHLSQPSVRRIISKEKARYQSMKEAIEQILPLWGIEIRRLSQIYPSAWEINGSCVLKVYGDRDSLERNIKTLAALSECGIPVAEIVPAKTGEAYVSRQNDYFLMSKKLQGSNISDIKDEKMAWGMGCAIARLHAAFIKCEKEIDVWDNSLLKEMKGWVRENLSNSGWQIVAEAEYSAIVETLEKTYHCLPRQLIHRDVHFGNFLFLNGEFSGYIDFDLCQKNIRIFDICYFLAGLLAEETAETLSPEEWLESVKSVIAGYESRIELSEQEKDSIACTMECIEILFAAYFIGMKDTKRANDACRVLHFIQTCENDIRNAVCRNPQ